VADIFKMLITIVDPNNDQWLQASMPVANGELGMRSAKMLASSACLSSAASTLTLQESILPSNIKSVPDQSVALTEIVWEALSSSPIPASNKQYTHALSNPENLPFCLSSCQ